MPEIYLVKTPSTTALCVFEFVLYPLVRIGLNELTRKILSRAHTSAKAADAAKYVTSNRRRVDHTQCCGGMTQPSPNPTVTICSTAVGTAMNVNLNTSYSNEFVLFLLRFDVQSMTRFHRLRSLSAFRRQAR